MIEVAEHAATRIGDDDLIAALQQALPGCNGEGRSIRRLIRRASPYQSSYPLEELTLFLHDGRRLDLIFKNVSPRALSAAARRAKPNFLASPRREIEIYRTLLADAALGAAQYYGSVIDPADNRYLLFLEKVSGQELYQTGEIDHWIAAARWSARFHSRFGDRDDLPEQLVQSLVPCDEAYYRLWFDRAVEFAHARGNASRLAAIQRLAELAPQVVEELLKLPTTLIHGEFYASNVIIHDGGNPLRVCPIDWERAAIGPGLIDLAALIAGDWPQQARIKMVAAYRQELLAANVRTPTDFLRGLNLCRFHLAIQWLGWSAVWRPPKDHRFDWLSEAAALATELGLIT